MKAGKPVSVGNHIPYVICEPLPQGPAAAPDAAAAGAVVPAAPSGGGKKTICIRYSLSLSSLVLVLR